MRDFVAITDLHLSSHSNVRTGDVLEDVSSKLEWVIKYCNDNDALLLIMGDVFDKATVPDLVKNRIFPIFKQAKYTPITIPGNHDELYGSTDFMFKTSYQTMVSAGLIENLNDVEFKIIDGVCLTSRLPLVNRGIPQIVLYHGFLNIEDGKNTLHFTDINTEDNCVICLGHDHVVYEDLQFTSNVKIIRPGSFLRGIRNDTQQRIPQLVHIRLIDGKLKTKKVPIKCRNWEEIFKTKEEKTSKAELHKSYEDIISQIRNAQVADITFAQAMKQVAEPDVVEYALQLLEEENLNDSFVKL